MSYCKVELKSNCSLIQEDPSSKMPEYDRRVITYAK